MAEKGKSPFYPGQPVPVELFAGRAAEIDHILTRGVGQVAAGKPVAMYVEGEYGIGKSSLAGFLQWWGQTRSKLHSVYAPIGAARSIEDVGQAILEASIRSGGLNPTRADKVRDWLGKYIGDQELFGVTLHLEALRRDAPDVVKGILPFLSQMRERMGAEVNGIFLVLDEINGIAASPTFAHFVKGLWAHDGA